MRRRSNAAGRFAAGWQDRRMAQTKIFAAAVLMRGRSNAAGRFAAGW